jgi:hypothetical protein
MIRPANFSERLLVLFQLCRCRLFKLWLHLSLSLKLENDPIRFPFSSRSGYLFFRGFVIHC